MSDDYFEKRIRGVIIGEIEQPTIVIADYNPAWPERFRQEEVRIVASLGQGALSVEHIGSTSVPGLAAKPTVEGVLGRPLRLRQVPKTAIVTPATAATGRPWCWGRGRVQCQVKSSKESEQHKLQVD